MKQYYDLVMADTIAKFKKEDVDLELPGTGFAHLPENERWKKIKETFSGGTYGVITEWGLIDFEPSEKETLVGGQDLTYDEYLNLQKKSGKTRRMDFEKAYYDAVYVSFKGQIERINAKKKKVCFERIFIYGQYSDGDGFVGKEDHVWMDLDCFESYCVGDCISFDAEVYRYVKKGNGKTMDFGLRNPENIRKIEEYELPSDEQLRLQSVDEIICNDLCMFKDHCYGYCIANQEWHEAMRKLLLGKL